MKLSFVGMWGGWRGRYAGETGWKEGRREGTDPHSCVKSWDIRILSGFCIRTSGSKKKLVLN